MKYLFIFAHPDDETVACAGTIKQLVDQGDEVIIVSATDGGAGELSEAVNKQFKGQSAKDIRRRESAAVAQQLGVIEFRFLDFEDGEITNQTVWGPLTLQITQLIDEFTPDVVVTFDHSGWYFHLDHVGVSIATTLAYHQAEHRPAALLFSHLVVSGSKWQYVFDQHPPITHRVFVDDRQAKLAALEKHASQNLSRIKQKVTQETHHYELYQLAFSSGQGQQLLDQHSVFEVVKS